MTRPQAKELADGEIEAETSARRALVPLDQLPAPRPDDLERRPDLLGVLSLSYRLFPLLSGLVRFCARHQQPAFRGHGPPFHVDVVVPPERTCLRDLHRRLRRVALPGPALT